MTTHEVLVRARNLIANGRVIAYSQFDGDGGHCAIGAISRAVDDRDRGNGFTHGVGADACVALREAASIPSAGLPSLPYDGIANWNNGLVTEGKPDAVIDGFDKAIAATAPEPDTEFLNNVAEPVAA